MICKNEYKNLHQYFSKKENISNILFSLLGDITPSMEHTEKQTLCMGSFPPFILSLPSTVWPSLLSIWTAPTYFLSCTFSTSFSLLIKKKPKINKYYCSLKIEEKSFSMEINRLSVIMSFTWVVSPWCKGKKKKMYTLNNTVAVE